MKDENDNKTVDARVSQIAVFERAVLVLKTIHETPVASTTEIRNKALSGMGLRTAQRYLKGLEALGLVYSICSGNNDDYRYFLTGKAKQLFGAQG